MIAHTNLVGCRKEELDTPALLIDLPTMECNIERMASTIIHEAGVNWRPHTKGMKSPALAHKLIDAGAIGVTCAKLGEAEVMAAGGVKDILIANQIVGPQKVARLVNLRKHADVMVAVDCEEHVEAIDRAAREKGVRVRLVIEINTGMDRAGVDPGEPVLALARKIHGREGVQLAGLFTWESIALRIEDPEEKKRMIDDALTSVTDSAQKCRMKECLSTSSVVVGRELTGSARSNRESQRFRRAVESSVTLSTVISMVLNTVCPYGPRHSY